MGETADVTGRTPPRRGAAGECAALAACMLVAAALFVIAVSVSNAASVDDAAAVALPPWWMNAAGMAARLLPGVAVGAVCFAAPVLVWLHRRVGSFLTVLVSVVVGVVPALLVGVAAWWVPPLAAGLLFAWPVVVLGVASSCGGVLLWLTGRSVVRAAAVGRRVR